MCRDLKVLCLISIKFCTCTNSHAVGVCAKFYGDLNVEFEVIGNIFSSSLGRNFVIISGIRLRLSGPRLNIKTVLSTYGDFHVKDKTAVRTSYL